MQSDGIETTLATLASKATYAGSGSAILGWLLSSEFAVLSGLIIGLTGLVINWYYKYRSDLRSEVEHQLRVVQLKRRHTDIPPEGDAE